MTPAALPARHALAGVSLIEDVRAAALASFQSYVRELDEPDLGAPLLWLIINVGASSVTPDALAEIASFVGDPDALMNQAFQGGWIETNAELLLLSPKSQRVVARLSAISQRNNQSWRDQLVESNPVAKLDEALIALRGAMSAKPG